MRRLLALCLLLSWGLSPAVLAQGIESDAVVPSSISTTIEQVSDVDARFVVETIDRKDSFLVMDPFLNQFNASLSGNAAQIVQRGDENITLLDQIGGLGNVASIYLEGSGNMVDATQNGNNNTLGISVVGNENVLPVLQDGHNLKMSLELDGTVGLTYSTPVTQTGNGGEPITIRITRSGTTGN
jgi:hypothetical protein